MKSEEIFKPIRGYEGLYEISNHGKVKSLPKTWGTRKTIGRKGETKLMVGKVDNGYPRVVLSKNSVKKSFSVHRLVAETFIENPNNYPIVNHKNSIRDDNYYENLEWTTYQGNAIHAFQNGNRKGKVGEINPQSKYKEKDIKIIKKLHSDGYYSQRQIAEMFDDSQGNISRIVNGKRWKHI